MIKQRAIVIGGGIHGITIALALADTNVNITLIERNNKLLQGTSAATHNRAHMGYHYPRSISTAAECIRGLECFKLKYPKALYYPKEAYYAIAKEGSKTSADDYIKFCDRMQIPYRIHWPSSEFLSREHVDISVLVPEPCFDLGALKRLLEKELVQKKVKVKTSSNIIGAKWENNETYTVLIKNNNTEEQITAGIMINATYAYSNNILNVCGLAFDRTEYYYHTTEVVVARSRKPHIPALTIMDGPFISVMPNAGYENLYLVYDVMHSVVHEQRDFLYEEPEKLESNWRKMIGHGVKYFPFLEALEFVTSLWGSRPVPVDDTVDSRHTRVVAHKASPGFYSIMEGKFISAPLIAQELVGMIRKDGLIR